MSLWILDDFGDYQQPISDLNLIFKLVTRTRPPGKVEDPPIADRLDMRTPENVRCVLRGFYLGRHPMDDTLR